VYRIRTYVSGAGGEGFKIEHLIVPALEIRWQQNAPLEHKINQLALLPLRVAALAEEVAWCPIIGHGARGMLLHGSSHVASQFRHVRIIQIIADGCGQSAGRHNVEEVVHNVPPIVIDLVE